jgi:hypothetical protein
MGGVTRGRRPRTRAALVGARVGDPAVDRGMAQIEEAVRRLERRGEIFTSDGPPEGKISAPLGSMALNIRGGAGTTLYVKESGGSSSTGWVGK